MAEDTDGKNVFTPFRDTSEIKPVTDIPDYMKGMEGTEDMKVRKDSKTPKELRDEANIRANNEWKSGRVGSS